MKILLIFLLSIITIYDYIKSMEETEVFESVKKKVQVGKSVFLYRKDITFFVIGENYTEIY